MNKKGFTLIELLIVVTIIGILAVALVPRIVGGSAGARDGRRLVDLQNISKGLEIYLSENGTLDDIGVGGNVGGSDYCASELSDDLSDYIGAIPTDPVSDRDMYNIFGIGVDDCDGEYVITLLDDDSGNLTKYAIAGFMETAEDGDANTAKANELNGVSGPTIEDYSDLSDASLDWGVKGTYNYYVVY